MENALKIAAVMGPAFLVMGLSMLFYANAWMEMIKDWSKNHYVLIIGGFLNLVLGLIVVNMYNVWQWNVWVIVTVMGWLMIAKSLFYFMAPGEWTKNLIKTFNNLNWLYFSSLLTIVLGAALSYYTYLA